MQYISLCSLQISWKSHLAWCHFKKRRCHYLYFTNAISSISVIHAHPIYNSTDNRLCSFFIFSFGAKHVFKIHDMELSLYSVFFIVSTTIKQWCIKKLLSKLQTELSFMDKHVTCDNRDELSTQPVVRGCRTADHNERFPNPL